MPLSEQEQRLLDEMERHLMQNDADVVTASGSGRGLSYRNLVYGSVLVLLGLGAIVAGIAVWNSVLALGITLGVLGFVAMVGGVVFAIAPGRAGAGRASSRPSASPRAASPRAGFMDRLNERWDRRQQDR